MWSHTKKPSHPASSASWANSAIRRTSLKLPKFGVLIANNINKYTFNKRISSRVSDIPLSAAHQSNLARQKRLPSVVADLLLGHQAVWLPSSAQPPPALT